MEYRQLICELRRIATEHDRSVVFVRDGANHEPWEIAGRWLTTPRHREVNERTARSIIELALEVVLDGES